MGINKRVMVALLAFMGFFVSLSVEAASPRSGAKLYNMHCTSCHGVRGSATMPGLADFSRGEGLFKPDAQLIHMIENGVGVMPAFRGLMSTNEILDVISYLRTLR